MVEVIFNIDENKELPQIVWSFLVKLRAEFICQTCSYEQIGITQEIYAHHRIPEVLGGLNTLKNGKCLCTSCHVKAHKALRLVYKIAMSREGTSEVAGSKSSMS